jgi:2'-5' RNA ligase
MRLFIAVNFDEGITDSILEIQEKLHSLALKGNFSRRENLHLTLAFLGETDAGLVPAIRNIIAALPSPGPFTVNFSRAGFFRHSGKDLWYIAATPDDPGLARLLELRNALANGLDGFNAASTREAASSDRRTIAFDKRPFNAHITLGREIRLSAEIAPFPVQLAAPIRRVSLMKSEHLNGRLVYTELFGREI